MRTIALAVLVSLVTGCAQFEAAAPPSPLEAESSHRLSSRPDAADERAPITREIPAAEVWAPLPEVPSLPAAALKPGIAPFPKLTVTAEAPPSATEADRRAPEGPPTSLWTRLKAGFRLADLDNDLVREWEQWYSGRPDYVARMVARSSHFLFYVAEQVEKRNMPMEIALLPMIESAYNPVAYSSAHASGMWQFIASTGRDYGLKQNWWYDGRRDVLEATDAALDYLEKLHSLFDDWQLALAAYNWGEGAVSRAIERNRAKGLPTDYESLVMPSETRNYVPKLIAVKNIISDAARFGLEVQDIPNEPYFETIIIERHIDVELAAKLAELPPDQFRFLNPGHKKPVIRAGEAERIVLPKENAATFRANLKRHGKPLVSWKTVRLQRGDRVHRVAAKHGMTVAELKRANGLASQRRLRAGQPLLVRVSTGVLNPQLPEISGSPVSLPRAISAAKAKASERKGSDTRRTVTRGRTGAKVRVILRQRSARVKQVRAARRGEARVVAPRATRSDSKRVSSRARSPRR